MLRRPEHLGKRDPDVLTSIEHELIAVCSDTRVDTRISSQLLGRVGLELEQGSKHADTADGGAQTHGPHGAFVL